MQKSSTKNVSQKFESESESDSQNSKLCDSEDDSGDSSEDSDEFATDVEDSDTEENVATKKSQITKNGLFVLSHDAFNTEYEQRSEQLKKAKESNTLTGGQFIFQHKLLDLEFREIAHLRELSGGKV
jgi:hypothetical protein